MESLNVQKRVEMLKVPKYVNKVLYLVPYRPHTKNVQKNRAKTLVGEVVLACR
jgi:hypothetical protein